MTPSTTEAALPNLRWADDVDEVLSADQAIMLATVTPAKGVVLMPVTNFAVRDRDAGTLTAANSSVGVSKKLERIRRDPRVALAYHTREHAFAPPRPEYVLVQGLATLSDPDPRYMDSIREQFELYAGGNPKGGLLWDRWLRGWHLRVGIALDVKRAMVWPDLACTGEPHVHGAPPPAAPTAQEPPRNGTAPRLDHRKAARKAARRPHVLLGWVGSDGFPVVVPVEIEGADDRGIRLRAPEAAVPPGGRRAGLTAHWFGDYNIGQDQQIHTGWMEAEGGTVVYAPHTQAGYRLPESRLAYRVIGGGATLLGQRAARRRGFGPAARLRARGSAA
jgi:hypothetical protein